MANAGVERDVGTQNLDFARALVGELHAAGVASVYVCPGSRSSPLAVAAAGCGGLPYQVHLDERSAAFHALGHALACGRPVALVCTSGTAGANFLPAVAEAFHSRVPLVVMTADRPPELRSWGAAQTMEQRTLFAGFTRWSEEAPCPSEGGRMVRYARALARRAVTASMRPVPGPVHLNLPCREPLLPAVVELPAAVAPMSTSVGTGAYGPGPAPGADGGTLARELAAFERGVLVFGPDTHDPGLSTAVQALAARLAWPVIADPASGLRAGPGSSATLISGADLLLRDRDTASRLRPDLVVRFGGLPVSKPVNEWIARHDSAVVWLVDPDDGFRDPQHRATRCLRLTSREFCTYAAETAAPARAESAAWAAEWRQADRTALESAASALAGTPGFLSPHVAQALWTGLPSHSALYVANSMAIREIDTFAGPREAELRVLAHRGVNGIDGLVSAACGAAVAFGRRTVLWCGDLALLHDLSGLLAGRIHGAPLTVVVANDDGGGIFEYLPAARALPRAMFERMLAAPHGRDLCAIATGLGWATSRVGSSGELLDALARTDGGAPELIEVVVDRAANTACHASVHAAVGKALQRGSPA